MSTPASRKPGTRTPAVARARRNGAPTGGTAPKYPIESVDKALRLLLLIGERSSLGVSEASRELGVAVSTAHRLLAMLQHHGLVDANPDEGTYRVGRGLVHLGMAGLPQMCLRNVARPFVEGLVDRVGETAHLVALRGDEVFFVDCVESSHAIRASSRVGKVLPAHATACGKAVLAQLDREEVLSLLPHERLTAVTPRTITSRPRLLRELDAVRERGYAVNRFESEEGLVAIAAAIDEPGRAVRASVTVAGPQERIKAARIDEIGRALIHAATEIGRRAL